MTQLPSHIHMCASAIKHIGEVAVYNECSQHGAQRSTAYSLHIAIIIPCMIQSAVTV